MKILATSDIHIGRRASKIPASAQVFASCANVWLEIVDLALNEDVDAVLLAGDIVDEKNKFFEALGPFEDGLKRLIEKRIHVVAVAGNHDFDVFPRIAKVLDHEYIHLLGEGGEWENKIFDLANGEKLQVIGRSFTNSSEHTSPLPHFPKNEIDVNIPSIGLLHADLDVKHSRYCPVTRQEFLNTEMPIWILGHIHQPTSIVPGQSSPILYPGSPQGMDPGEAGSHGVLMIEFSGLNPSFKHQAISKIRYENIEVSLDNIEEDFFSHVAQVIRGKIDEWQTANKNLKAVSLRLQITGRTATGREEIKETLYSLMENGMTVGPVDVYLNKFSIAISPLIDLNERAKQKSIDGNLAQMIIDLSDDSKDAEADEEYKELLELINKNIDSVLSEPVFGGIVEEAEDLQAGKRKEIVIQQAWLLLDMLDKQKREAAGNV